MRRWLRTLALLLLPGVVLAAWGYVKREQLARQWTCYRVGTAASLDEAKGRIAWFETGPDRPARLQELVRKWGTGNRQFDLYLAQYVSQPASSELLRATFSAEIGRRREVLPRWAHYWSYRVPLEPDQEIASMVRYLDALVSAHQARKIAWREVLGLQAVLQLTSHGRFARDLSPENWQARYRRWQQCRPTPLPHVARPEAPFGESLRQ